VQRTSLKQLGEVREDEDGHLAAAGGAAEEAAAVLRVGVRAAGTLPL